MRVKSQQDTWPREFFYGKGLVGLPFVLCVTLIITSSCMFRYEEQRGGTEVTLPPIGLNPDALPPSCFNGVEDQDEVAVDCGGGCGPCGVRFTSVGIGHTIATHTNGSLYVWGSNRGNLGGALGLGEAIESAETAMVLDLGDRVTHALATDFASCAVLADASAWCWGHANDPEVGHAGFLPSSLLERVGGEVRTVSDAGMAVSVQGMRCVLHLDGGVSCSGRMTNEGNELREVERVASLSEVVTIAGGWAEVMALHEDGSVSRIYDDVVLTDSFASRAVSIAAGYHAHFAVLEDGSLMGTGADNRHQLANGPDNQSHNDGFIAIEGVPASRLVAAGYTGHAAVDAQGQFYAWGTGRSVTAEAGGYSVATPVDRIERPTAVAVGGEHGCAIDEDAKVYCWGVAARDGTSAPASQLGKPVEGIPGNL